MANFSLIISELKTLSAGHVLLVLVFLVMAAAFTFTTLRARFDQSYLLIASALFLGTLFSFGHDSTHHNARVFEMSAHLFEGDLDLFTNMGEIWLPTFYFYSPAFYVFSAPLVAVGFDEIDASRIIASLFFLQMAIFLKALFFEFLGEEKLGLQRPNSTAFVVCIIFLTSNYVYSNFIMRAAYPEASALSLVPIILLQLHRRSWAAAICLIALQICIHPPVILQSTFIIVLTYLLFFGRPVLEGLLKLSATYAVAVALSFPAWFWAYIDRNEILGSSGLPLKFQDSFLGILSIANPVSIKTSGLYIVVLLASYLLYSRKISRLALVSVTIAAITFLLQTRAFVSVTELIPLVDIGLFVWRWMIVPIWFLTLALFLVYDHQKLRKLTAVVVTLAGLQAISMAIIQTIPPRNAAPETYFEHVNLEPFWGRSEFFPSYFHNFGECTQLDLTEVTQAGFAELRRDGLASDLDLAIMLAPTAGLRYTVNAEVATTSTCGPWLIISNPQRGTTSNFAVEMNIPLEYPEIRVMSPVIYLLLAMFFVILTHRRTRRINQGS